MEVAHVPVGRRNLFSERRRAFLGIAGVAVSLLMVLALGGIFEGAMRGVTRYVDTSGADLFVSQQGIRTMHMSSSTIPLGVLDEIGALPGVRWADPILYDSGALVASERRELTSLIGYVPGSRGGPTSLVVGTEPGPGEIVLDERAAGILEVGVGDQAEILDRSWRVSGLTTGMTSIVNSVSYVPFDDFARARGLRGIASYVLVGSDDPAALVSRIGSATGLTVQSRAELSSQERQGVKDMSTELMEIMTFAGFLIGLAVIGLTLYAATLSRLREVGVMKALGATPLRLRAVVLSQATWTMGFAMAIALLLALGLGWISGRTGGTFPLVLETPSVIRVAIGAAALGALGAIAPLVKVSRVDPATVFRR